MYGASPWLDGHEKGVATMRKLSAALITVALAVTTSCGESATVGPTSSPSSPSAGSAPPAPDVPVQPGYTVTGQVTDRRGTPVAGAEIWIYGNDSPIDDRYGVGFTDIAGRYRVTSPTRPPHTVRAIKDGYLRQDVPIRGSLDSSTWAADLTLVHIDRYEIVSPTEVAVGEYARLQTRADLDDGSSQSGFVYLDQSSDNPSVLRTEPFGWVIGVASGTATLTARYYGAIAARRIRVVAD